jgi:competence protein ComEA
MILVGNMGASGWLLLTSHGSFPEEAALPSGFFSEVRRDAWKEEAVKGGRTGPLTFRQTFLAGRRLDLNRAEFQEISDLPGISDPVAKAIVKERERRGGFRRPEDLLAVPGIKEKRLKKILPFISLFPNN